MSGDTLKRWVIPYLIGGVFITLGLMGAIDVLTTPGPQTAEAVLSGILFAPLGVLIPMTIDGGWE